MKNSHTLLTLALYLILSSSTYAQVSDIDGHQYPTQKIGTQVWLSQNLNVSHFRNGDAIPEAKNLAAWNQAVQQKQPMWCYYDLDATNGKTHGKLYNWFAVRDPRGLAPLGWHIPSLAEFDILIHTAGGLDQAGANLISSALWGEGEKASNETGFSALPSGTLYNSGKFEDLGASSYFWTSTPISNSRIHYIDIWVSGCFGSMVDNGDEAYIEEGLSVRCVQD